ncbi:hypothetical protein [Denitrobaculum tricleocarpae]|uniref:Chromosomal replication initiator protein DnaA n=1 Tax=Denitrobaculum tricleocarpae TaxID=2591009 RepID=A0A545TSZ1_9PROT|nr:hypothetical protein [Denitrobaculum tricleocarpae]TQV80336.1 hypothetical protein FKG95_09075 [Denitrobaculum tricleocarpae]
MRRRKPIQRKTPRTVGFRDRNLFNQIMGAVCRVYGVHETAVWGHSIGPTACRARLMALYIMRSRMTARNAEIAAMMGVPTDEVADSQKLVDQQIEHCAGMQENYHKIVGQLPQVAA